MTDADQPTEVSEEQALETAEASVPQELDETQPSSDPGGEKIDIDLLMDVQVNLSVELGRIRMPIKDLMTLNHGSVVGLDRSVNEPLDLMVNGTLIAHGEVVESQGKFGLRLLDLVSPGERLKKLK
ncbi:MAG: flagellar motor switch protein FliN [Pseudomonadota bacterium]